MLFFGTTNEQNFRLSQQCVSIDTHSNDTVVSDILLRMIFRHYRVYVFSMRLGLPILPASYFSHHYCDTDNGLNAIWTAWGTGLSKPGTHPAPGMTSPEKARFVSSRPFGLLRVRRNLMLDRVEVEYICKASFASKSVVSLQSSCLCSRLEPPHLVHPC